MPEAFEPVTSAGRSSVRSFGMGVFSSGWTSPTALTYPRSALKSSSGSHQSGMLSRHDATAMAASTLPSVSNTANISSCST